MTQKKPKKSKKIKAGDEHESGRERYERLERQVDDLMKRVEKVKAVFASGR